jgi:AcrR family transcriptional regulator
MTVEQIARRARVSTRTFNSLFENREACLDAAFEDAVSLATERVRRAYERDAPWAERVRAGLLALLLFFDQRPELARLCFVEALAAGGPMLSRCREVTSSLAMAVHEDGSAASGGHCAALTAARAVGEVLGSIHARLLEEDGAPLSEMVDQLANTVVAPYLEEDAASGELSRPESKNLGRTTS